MSHPRDQYLAVLRDAAESIEGMHEELLERAVHLACTGPWRELMAREPGSADSNLDLWRCDDPNVRAILAAVRALLEASNELTEEAAPRHLRLVKDGQSHHHSR